MDRRRLVGELESTAEMLGRRGFDVRPVVIDDPAMPREIAELEAVVGFRFPAEYRSALLSLSRHVGVSVVRPPRRPRREGQRSCAAPDVDSTLGHCEHVGRYGWSAGM